MQRIGNYCDDETRAAMSGLLSFLSPSEQRALSNYAKERKEAFISGVAMVPDYWQRALYKYDPTLQMRWSFDYHRFVIDRWIEDLQYWHTILIWQTDGNIPLGLSEMYIPLLISILERNNLQRQYANEREYLRKKQDAAQEQKDKQDKVRTEMVLEAVDSLSTKSINNFIEVHRALHTGETIVAHGADEKFLDRAAENTKKIEAELGGPAIPMARELNPGMHPLKYKRQPR